MERKKQSNNKGFTLVELIVTFVLLSLFLVAATMVISSIVRLYYQARGITYARQVSGIVMNKIVGELEGARSSGINQTSEAIVIAPDNSAIEFIDRTGSHVNMKTMTKDGADYFALHYYAVPSATGSGANQYEAVDWTFDSKAYMGYEVTSLTFSKAEPQFQSNVIKVELTIASERYGSYDTTEYVQCYNFDDADAVKIVTNDITTDFDKAVEGEE
jgi:Tfp pilus assembly protein FimT